jgi:hypothetical protein
MVGYHLFLDLSSVLRTKPTSLNARVVECFPHSNNANRTMRTSTTQNGNSVNKGWSKLLKQPLVSQLASRDRVKLPESSQCSFAVRESELTCTHFQTSNERKRNLKRGSAPTKKYVVHPDACFHVSPLMFYWSASVFIPWSSSSMFSSSFLAFSVPSLSSSSSCAPSTCASCSLYFLQRRS